MSAPYPITDDLRLYVNDNNRQLVIARDHQRVTVYLEEILALADGLTERHDSMRSCQVERRARVLAEAKPEPPGPC